MKGFKEQITFELFLDKEGKEGRDLHLLTYCHMSEKYYIV